MWTFKPVYDPTFLKSDVPVLGGNEKGFNAVTLFEMHLDPQVVACLSEPFSKSVDVWYDPLLLLGWLPVVFVHCGCCVCS